MTDTTIKQTRRSVVLENYPTWKDADRDQQNLLINNPSRDFRIRHRADGTFDLVEKVPLVAS